MVIVKYQFVTGKYQHTAYVYDGTVWAAMDGNYNAENVYFKNDFVFTENVGTVKIPETGSIEVEAAGLNVAEFFNNILQRKFFQFQAFFLFHSLPPISQDADARLHTKG